MIVTNAGWPMMGKVFEWLLKEAAVDFENHDVLVQSVFSRKCDRIFIEEKREKFPLHIFVSWEAYGYDRAGACMADVALLNRTDLDRHFKNPCYYPLFLYAMTHDEDKSPLSNIYYEKVDENTPFCNCIIGNGNRQRVEMFENISKYKQIQSYGNFKRNTKIIIPKFYKRHFMLKPPVRAKFNLCPENSYFLGYITEKTADAFLTAHLPIWWGDAGIFKKFVNEENTVFYKGHEETLRKIIEIDENEERYSEMISKAPKYGDMLPFHADVLQKIHDAAKRKGMAL